MYFQEGTSSTGDNANVGPSAFRSHTSEGSTSTVGKTLMSFCSCKKVAPVFEGSTSSIARLAVRSVQDAVLVLTALP